MKTQEESYQAGIEAAKNGSNINNSHPYDHASFVAGHKSISNQEEDLALKAIWAKAFPDEYPQ